MGRKGSTGDGDGCARQASAGGDPGSDPAPAPLPARARANGLERGGVIARLGLCGRRFVPETLPRDVPSLRRLVRALMFENELLRFLLGKGSRA